ncbi:hypothetical protein [Bradyrhizobium sp. 63_E2_N1_3]|uniref:hypothetical protein n=1 Tax=Bradyrhizobium sp. 63_E2_N1_3 TaxID=3240373 RepID=UPI003F8B76A7
MSDRVSESSRPPNIGRHVRTDFIFPDQYIPGERRERYDFSVAYLKDVRDLRLESYAVSHLKSARPSQLVKRLIRAQTSRSNHPREVWEIGVRSQTLLREKIVIEKSPPTVQTLLSLIESARAVDLFSLDAKTLVAVAVLPVGGVVLGAIKGVSKGLEKGISGWVQERFKKKKTKPKKIAKKRKKLRLR